VDDVTNEDTLNKIFRKKSFVIGNKAVDLGSFMFSGKLALTILFTSFTVYVLCRPSTSSVISVVAISSLLSNAGWSPLQGILNSNENL